MQYYLGTAYLGVAHQNRVSTPHNQWHYASFGLSFSTHYIVWLRRLEILDWQLNAARMDRFSIGRPPWKASSTRRLFEGAPSTEDKMGNTKVGSRLVLKTWEHLEVRERVVDSKASITIYIHIYIQIPDDLLTFHVSGFELAFDFSSLTTTALSFPRPCFFPRSQVTAAFLWSKYDTLLVLFMCLCIIM